jgi:hypothetical protein
MSKATTAAAKPKGSVNVAGTPSKGRGGLRGRKAGPKSRRGVKERAVKRGVLSAGGRRTLRAADVEDERNWLDW